MEKQGVITTYDTGRMIICKENCDTIYNYITVDIIIDTTQLPDNIIQIPPSEYFCITAAKDSLFKYNDIFLELGGKNKIIIEAELFTPEYNSENPQYELRCLSDMDFISRRVTVCAAIIMSLQLCRNCAK